jgi:polyphosphate kinase
VLAAIQERAQELQQRHATVFRDQVKPELDAAGIHIESWTDLDADDRSRIDDIFAQQIFPVLMPLAVDPAHPFPYISGLSLNLSIRVRNPKTRKQEFARLKVPPMLPRFVQLPDDESGHLRFIPLEDLISNHLGDLFPGMEILEHHEFRVTRNEDVQIDEDESENLIQSLERELLRRRFGPPIRLEITDDMDDVTLGLLVRELEITEQEVYRLPAPLDLGGLFEVTRIDRPELKYPPHVPTTSVNLMPAEPTDVPDVFASVSKRDILLHHPYESFATSVQAFLEQAAVDPAVLAIKMTLYRTSGDSPIVEALINAAENGKAVLALVEIKARFDETANINWAKKLEKAGVHVVYGMVGLKTHCKLALAVRQEDGVLRHYSHIGTGNYNPKTSRIYEDLGLLTTDAQVGKDLTRLFNELSGYAIEKKFKRLLVAPLHLRKGLLKRIAMETANAENGLPSGIRIKVNSIVDEAITDALYRASMAGVPIELLVRGICGLKPGIPELSENIQVRSILGRYLEHSRIFSFLNNGDPQVYIGSADLMHRNLDRRVEVLVRLTDPEHLREIDELFDLAMSDDTSSWTLEADGTWTRHHLADDGTPLRDMQNVVMRQISQRKRTGVLR